MRKLSSLALLLLFSHCAWAQIDGPPRAPLSCGTGVTCTGNKISVTGVTSFNSRTGAVSPASADYNAGQVTYTPPGTGASANTVQAEVQRYGVWANDFGAVCNGSTDDSFAFQGAINEAIALGIAMRFTGTCAIHSTLSVTAATEIAGSGPPLASEILVTSTAINGITVSTTAGVYFHDFAMNYSSTPGGGQAEILLSPGGGGINAGSRFERLNLLSTGEICMELQNSAYWTVVNSQIACQLYAIDVSDASNADAGDSTIYGNLLQVGPGGAPIRWQSSGGLRIVNNKMLSNASSYGILVTLASGASTGVMVIANNSIEGVSTSGGAASIAFIRQGATGAFGTIMITGNEFTGYYGMFVPTDANGVWLQNMTITGNVCSCSFAGFSIDSVSGLVLSNNEIFGNGSTIPISIGSHGFSATNCVAGPNPHNGAAAASGTGACTAIAPN
jgi:hypothetical protein